VIEMNQNHNSTKSSWPIVPYLLAWCFSAFLLSFPLLDGIDTMVRYKIYTIFLGLTLIRLIWARIRREKNKGWLFYLNSKAKISTTLWEPMSIYATICCAIYYEYAKKIH